MLPIQICNFIYKSDDSVECEVMLVLYEYKIDFFSKFHNNCYTVDAKLINFAKTI